MNMRTPLKRVNALGSAKEGADHFWTLRVTAVANLLLTLFLVWLIVSLVGADYATVKSRLAHPVNAIGLGLLAISGTIHMRLGMQVIIEDYVHGAMKLPLLILNTFFAVAVGLVAIFALLKLAFGG